MSSIPRVAFTAAVAALVFLVGTVQTVSADTYKMVESAFNLANITGNPFDYQQNDVQVTFTTPAGKQEKAPAFFDGGTTWRVRYTPQFKGKYSVTRVFLNGAELPGVVPAPSMFVVDGAPQPGFVRISAADPFRFAFDNGVAYFPLGNDVAWSAGANNDVTDFFPKMGAAGENWSRVWMCHWDGKNLDWPRPKEGEGWLNLTVARHWDAIIEAAQKSGIYFQMTLQHHGQYATMVDPNWSENPWSSKNGGFLDTPEQFFTNEHARTLTKAKYRYIIARYGYSPNIMAWELFNEVEGTDAGRKQLYAPIAAWHKEMAAFIRSHDLYHHLVTTSSDFRVTGLFDAMDYFQPHSYSPDPMAAIAGIVPKEYGKPVFFGEMGPSSGGLRDPDFVRTILWSSIMSSNSGAGQYWFWDQVTAQHLFPIFAAATAFLKISGLEGKTDLKSTHPEVITTDQGNLSFGPGGGWQKASKTTFTIEASGSVQGAGAMPSFFQGKAHHDMFPSLDFDVNYAAPGDFAVSIGNVAKAGAALALLIDGKPVANHDFAPAVRDTFANVTLHASVPAGRHQITLENSGADWVSISRFTLKPYGAALHALARQGENYVAAWVYRSDEPSHRTSPADRLMLTGITKGRYEIVFWDPVQGKVVANGGSSVGDNGTAVVVLPHVDTSIALYMMKDK